MCLLAPYGRSVATNYNLLTRIILVLPSAGVMEAIGIRLYPNNINRDSRCNSRFLYLPELKQPSSKVILTTTETTTWMCQPEAHSFLQQKILLFHSLQIWKPKTMFANSDVFYCKKWIYSTKTGLKLSISLCLFGDDDCIRKLEPFGHVTGDWARRVPF